MKLLSTTFLLLTVLISPVHPCFNNPNFSYFYAGMYRTCQNIRIDEFRRQEMCGRFSEVGNQCPQTCGRCCVDDEEYRFRTRRNSPIEVPCTYVAGNKELQDRFCRKWSAGRMIRDACPVSCDFCQPAVLQRPPTPTPNVVSPPPTPSPTKFPTPSPTAAPTKSPTKSPTKPPTSSPSAKPTNPPRSGEPTPSPTKAPTKSPTKTPTKPPTASPTFSSSKPTFLCENDLTYYADNDPNLTCLKIGEDEFRRNRYCRQQEVKDKCPQTCGICCRDDKSWKFTTYLGTRKRCAWMKGERIRKNRYCEKVRNGRLMKLACPVTCDFCFNPVQ